MPMFSTATSSKPGARLAAAHDYPALQGLHLVAIGIPLSPLAAAPSLAPYVVALIALGSLGAMTRYQRTYGATRPSGTSLALTATTSAAAAFTLLVASGLDAFKPGPFLWCPLVSAGWLAALCLVGLRHVGLTAWHWVTFAALAACTLLPITGVHLTRAADVALLGPALVVIGVVDHRRLTAMLAPLEQR